MQPARLVETASLPMDLGGGPQREPVAELAALVAALQDRAPRMRASAERPRPIVLPTYGGARRRPNLTALLALLLRRYGVPVLLHGMRDEFGDFGRVTTLAILQELGFERATTVADANRWLDDDGIAYAPIGLISPQLARWLASDGPTGARSSAHTLAKLIDPFDGDGLRVVGVSHSRDLRRMREYLAQAHADALLLHGTEGQPVANPQRQPRIEWFQDGASTVLFDAEVGPLTTPADLPRAIDASATAAWIAAALAGNVPIPAPIVNQLACCMHATRRANASVDSRSGQNAAEP